MSYLLEGTGPVTVADQELTSENVVEDLLSRPYLELDPVQQDAVFREAASSIFEAATGDLADPVAFVKGLGRATDEGRFLVASFDEAEDQALVGTRVRGALCRRRRSHPARGHRPQRRHRLEDVLLPALQRGGASQELLHR